MAVERLPEVFSCRQMLELEQSHCNCSHHHLEQAILIWLKEIKSKSLQRLISSALKSKTLKFHMTLEYYPETLVHLQVLQ